MQTQSIHRTAIATDPRLVREEPHNTVQPPRPTLDQLMMMEMV